MRADLVIALGSPTLRVRRADGSELQFNSAADVKARITAIDGEIAKLQGAPITTRVAQQRRGDGQPWGPGWPYGSW